MPRSIRSTAPRPESRASPDAELTVPLRLTIARGALGLELYRPIEIGPMEVHRLGVALPDLKFPVDLSGGVRVFRHRRGRLQHVGLRVRLDVLARWLDRRLRETLGGLVRPVAVFRVPGGIGVGLVGLGGAVAFDLLWAPVEGDARVVVARARGADLQGSALGVALQAVDTAVGRFTSRVGRIVSLPSLGAAVVREVLPSVGARAPSARGVRCAPLEGEGDLLLLDLDAAFPPPAVADEVVRALELGLLTETADDALSRGDVDAAREGYVAALERAPRHPEIARLVAEIDAHASGRAEAALSMLADSMAPSESGAIGAMLLARVGDLDGALTAVAGATREEEFAPLAALLWCQQAEYSRDAASRLLALDEAVARCPGLLRGRRLRFDARLARGDVAGALADAEHLEAATTGSVARHDVCRSLAQRLLELGYQRDAGRLFERALRYVPDDAEATAGLGRALVESGRTERAVALFERAIALGDARGVPQGDALVDLAKILAKMGDRPQAIARVRQVTAASPRLVEARALEGVWREQLGDLAGATVAYGRLRETIELAPPADPRSAADYLRTAARFEWETRKEASVAERHLGVALRLLPHDRSLGEAYREMAAIAAAVRARPNDD